MTRLGSLVACAAVLGLCAGCGDELLPEVRVTISPAAPTTADDLVATVEGRTGLALRWSVDGAVRADATADRIAAALTTKHETWRVEAVADGTALAAAEVTIGNAAPVPPALALPAAPIAGAPIACTLAGAATDPDGDAVQATLAWTLNGAPFTAATTTVVPGDTVPPRISHTGNDFACTVTVTDSEATATATAAVRVAPRLAYLIRQDVTPQLLRTIDLDTGTLATIGPLDVTYAFGDLAWDRAGQKLYMIDGRGARALYAIDTATGATTRIGTHGLTDALALAFDPADGNRLYAITASGTANTLYRLDVATGAATLVGPLAGPTSRMEGLAFDSKRNALVGATVDGAVGTLDVLTGAVTPAGAASPLDDFGMTYDPFVDRFWAVDASRRLISIDPDLAYASTIVAPSIGVHTGIAIALPP